jgi:hypothetical protein
MARYLQEHLSFTQARAEVLLEEAQDGSGTKTMKLKGICIEGGVKKRQRASISSTRNSQGSGHSQRTN